MQHGYGDHCLQVLTAGDRHNPLLLPFTLPAMTIIIALTFSRTPITDNFFPNPGSSTTISALTSSTPRSSRPSSQISDRFFFLTPRSRLVAPNRRPRSRRSRPLERTVRHVSCHWSLLSRYCACSRARVRRRGSGRLKRNWISGAMRI